MALRRKASLASAEVNSPAPSAATLLGWPGPKGWGIDGMGFPWISGIQSSDVFCLVDFPT